jgi:hypothetical protein
MLSLQSLQSKKNSLGRAGSPRLQPDLPDRLSDAGAPGHQQKPA